MRAKGVSEQARASSGFGSDVYFLRSTREGRRRRRRRRWRWRSRTQLVLGFVLLILSKISAPSPQTFISAKNKQTRFTLPLEAEPPESTCCFYRSHSAESNRANIEQFNHRLEQQPYKPTNLNYCLPSYFINFTHEYNNSNAGYSNTTTATTNWF